MEGYLKDLQEGREPEEHRDFCAEAAGAGSRRDEYSSPKAEYSKQKQDNNSFPKGEIH